MDEVRIPEAHAFISYVREDAGRVDDLQLMLETAGIKVWRDTRELWPGQDWRLNVRRAISEEALVFLACFSKASLAKSSSYQNEELVLALEQLRQRLPGHPWLIPVRFDRCDIPDYDIGGGRRLSDIQRADLFGEESADSAARLVTIVLGILARRHGRDDLTGEPAKAIPAQGAPRLPGVLPAVYNAPPAIAAFTGRETLLARLGEALSTDPQPVVVQAVHGMGGVGKTALVLQYLHATANLYRLIWWIDAQQQMRIGEQLAALGREAGWVPAGVEIDLAIDMTRQRLRTTPGWLLVFDNATSPEDIFAWLPQGPGHVLITSRDRHWGEVSTVTSISVDVFHRAESVALLRRLRPALAEADANRIAEALGHLPLALAQAGGVLSTTATEAYLAQLRDRVSMIMSQGSPLNYPTSLAAVVHLANKHLGDQDLAAAQLIRICASLAPEPIPVTWLAAAATAGSLPEPVATAVGDPIETGTILRSIASHGLATVDPAGTLTLHQLTSAIIAEALNGDDRDLSRRQAESILIAAQPPGAAKDPATWPRWAQLIPHVLTWQPTGAADNGWWILAANAAWYLQQRGLASVARPLAAAVYQFRLRYHGADHPDTLAAADDLATVLWQLGRHDEALIFGQETLACRRQLDGDDDPSTLRTAGNLSNVLRATGRLDEAAALETYTLTRRRRVLGEDHLETLLSASNLAVTLLRLRRFSRALALNQEVLAHRQRMLGEGHPDTLMSAGNLGATLFAMGRFAESFKVNQDVVTLRRQILGEDHPQTLNSVSNLATELRLRGHAVTALALDEDTLARRRKVLGENHPDTLSSIVNLAADLAVLKRFAEALDFSQDVLRRLQRVLGEHHPDTLIAADLLTAIYRRTRRLGKLWPLAWRTARLMSRRQRQHLWRSWQGGRATISSALRQDDLDRQVPVRLKHMLLHASAAVVSSLMFVNVGIVLLTGRRLYAAVCALFGLLITVSAVASLISHDTESALTQAAIGLSDIALAFLIERRSLRRWRTTRHGNTFHNEEPLPPFRQFRPLASTRSARKQAEPPGAKAAPQRPDPSIGIMPDHGGFQHYTENSKTTVNSVILKRPITAFCGWTWIPGRIGILGEDLDDLPICPQCKLLRDLLPGPK